MTYEELVKNADEAAKLINADSIREHAAIEIDVEGEGEGAFYIELDEGKTVVEPYEYYDKDCRIRTTADVIRELFSGKLDLDTAISSNRLRIEGNAGKFAFLADIIKEAFEAKATEQAKDRKAAKPVKKATTRKTAVKKAVEAEVKEETAAVVEEKPVKKTAVKKTTTKKAASETTEQKATEKKTTAKRTAKKAAESETAAASEEKPVKKTRAKKAKAVAETAEKPAKKTAVKKAAATK